MLLQSYITIIILFKSLTAVQYKTALFKTPKHVGPSKSNVNKVFFQILDTTNNKFLTSDDEHKLVFLCSFTGTMESSHDTTESTVPYPDSNASTSLKYSITNTNQIAKVYRVQINDKLHQVQEFMTTKDNSNLNDATISDYVTNIIEQSKNEIQPIQQFSSLHTEFKVSMGSNVKESEIGEDSGRGYAFYKVENGTFCDYDTITKEGLSLGLANSENESFDDSKDDKELYFELVNQKYNEKKKEYPIIWDGESDKEAVDKLNKFLNKNGGDKI